MTHVTYSLSGDKLIIAAYGGKKTFGAKHFLFLLMGCAHKQKKKMIRSLDFF
jgi:hypothetical protein